MITTQIKMILDRIIQSSNYNQSVSGRGHNSSLKYCSVSVRWGFVNSNE